MPPIHRRELAAVAGAMALAPFAAGADKVDETADRKFVTGAGLTDAEAKCWELIGQAAGAFFDLPELHPMDKAEVASAIHVVQNKLLSRPTYRKYLELAKAGAKK